MDEALCSSEPSKAEIINSDILIINQGAFMDLVLVFLEAVKEVASSSQVVMIPMMPKCATGSGWFHCHFNPELVKYK